MPNVIRFPKPHRVAPFSLILHCHDQKRHALALGVDFPGCLAAVRPSIA